MITLLLAIALGLVLLAEIIDGSTNKFGFLAVVPGVLGAVFTIVFGIWTLCNIIVVASGFGIQEKIQIYEDQNTQIEQSIDAAVKAYCEHEQITYVQMSDGAVALVAAAYPELASSELVKTQMEVWTSNSKELKDLKSDLVDFHRAQYFLYFGGELS
jgi:hypothetical protein